jgi:transcriptional regulator with XRE-family HTH domain
MVYVYKNIKLLRKKIGLTQEQLASKLNVKRSSIGAYEENRAVPARELLKEMATMFGVSMDQLYDFDFSSSTADIFGNGNIPSANSDHSLVSDTHRLVTENIAEIPEAAALMGYPKTDIFSKNTSESAVSTSKLSQRNTIPYISTANLQAYIQSHDLQSFTDSLPQIQLPQYKLSNGRAFEAQADFPVPGATILCDVLGKNEAIENAADYVLVLRNGTALFRKVFDLTAKGCLLLSANVEGIISSEIPVYDVLQVCKFVGYISSELPKNQILNPKIKALLAELGHEINKLS